MKQESKRKSRELVEEAKVVITAIGEPIDVSNAKKLEDEKKYFEAYSAYTDAIRTYKVNKDIHGGLSSELRKQIGSFEKAATTRHKQPSKCSARRCSRKRKLRTL